MTTNDLAAIRARADKATPGPWVTRPVSELWDGDYEGSNGCNLWLATEWKGAKGPNLGADEMLNQDAEFTAHARQDIPALLDELAAAREENERLREALDLMAQITYQDTDTIGEMIYGIASEALRDAGRGGPRP